MRRSVFLCFVLLAFHAQAQTPYVGIPYFDQALQRAQLLGQLDSSISFTVRPVDAVRAAGIQDIYRGDSLLFPADTNRYASWAKQKHKKDDEVYWALLPLVAKYRLNIHHPYSRNDGPMITAKGSQIYHSLGVYGRAKWFEMQLVPELVWAENQILHNPPARVFNIDNPDRFGEDPYQRIFLGQSFLKLHLGPVAVGVSNENVWWGPGQTNAILMSNNAPGFLHLSIHSNKPIATPIGSFEFQLIGGRARYSGFSGYATQPDSITDTLNTSTIVPNTQLGEKPHSWISAGVMSYQPKWIPGLFLGVTRAVQDIDRPNLPWFYFGAFNPLMQEEFEADGSFFRNQLISVFAKYAIPKVGFEVYVEVGREDRWWDFEDLMTDPMHSTVWLAGMRRIRKLPGKSHWLETNFEVTRLQAPVATLIRSTGYSFYSHFNGVGWTNRGQVMGAGIAPGSNLHHFSVNWNREYFLLGLGFERLSHSEDLFVTSIPYIRRDRDNLLTVDYTKRWIDWSVMMNFQLAWRGIFLGGRTQLVRTYNYKWLPNPNSGPASAFRLPGYNLWSQNYEGYIIYRF
ncbi:MAG: capsule assembly Wzi family protein [Bacteroidia bacterium]